MENKKESRDQT